MNPFVGLARLIDGILQVYLWIIFGTIIFSWIPIAPHNLTAQKMKHILQLLTKPVFSFFRRTLRLDRLYDSSRFGPFGRNFSDSYCQIICGTSVAGGITNQRVFWCYLLDA